MSGNLIGFGKNDKKIMSGGDVEYYRGERNRTDLISFCWFYKDEATGEYQMGEDHTPKMVAEEIHYIKGKGYILDNDYLRDKLGPPKRKIGTFIVQYRTDRKGNPLKPFEYDVKPWTFGEDKYRKMANLHGDFPLTKYDLKVDCEDDTFQKLTFRISPKEAIWQQRDSLKQEILETVEAMEDRLSIGREVPLDELKDHFGDDVSPAPDASSDVDYDDLMAGIE